MKRIILLSCISLLLTMTGCQSDELTISSNKDIKEILSPEELLSVQCKKSTELNQTEIFNLLEAFRSIKSGINSRMVYQPISFNIKEKYYLKPNRRSKNMIENQDTTTLKEQIPIYKVELISENGQGMAVVSGDRRAPYVLAYIDKIEDEQTTLAPSPTAMLQWGEMHILNEIMTFNTMSDSLYYSAMQKITKNLNYQDTHYEVLKNEIILNSRSTPIPDIPSNLTIKLEVLPMCPVTWGQWEPYNCKLSEGICEKMGRIEKTNYPAGCGVVNVAHIFACMDSNPLPMGIAIRWSALLEDKEIKDSDEPSSARLLSKKEMVGRIFKEIYEGTNSYAIKNSTGVIIGTTSRMSDVENFLSKYLSCGKKTSWNISTVKNSLKDIKPVFVYGEADNKAAYGVTPFILDGIVECYGRINNVPKDIDICYLHANFGFGHGYQDGFYLMDVQKNTITFETNIPLIFKDNAMKIIPNIYKSRHIRN